MGTRAVVLTVLTVLGMLGLGAVTASAAAVSEAQTRVGVCSPETITAVGVSENIAAGQGRGPPLLQGEFVVANGVAAESAPARFITTGAGTTIDRAAVSTSIIAQWQGRHVLGARQYSGGSYFNSADDAQGALDAFHGELPTGRHIPLDLLEQVAAIAGTQLAEQ